MKVLLLSRHTAGSAATRLRALQYLPHLAEAGIHVDVAPFFEDDYLPALYSSGRVGWKVARGYARRLKQLAGSKEYDLLWVEKEALPWLPGRVENFLLRSKPVVVDFDDAQFHAYDTHSNPLVRALLGKRVDRVMREAEVVVVGNEYLATRARSAGAARVEYLPTVIDLTRYPSSPHHSASPGNEFNIGWIGSPGSEYVLDPFRATFSRVLDSAGTRLTLVGASERALPDPRVDRRPWSEDTEVDSIRTFDVGIMPLPDTPWMRGKCGYKLIQYMGCGLPVVASPVGVNRELVRDGWNGYLAETPDEWVAALERIRADPEAAAAMGQRGRSLVEEKYSLAVAAPQLERILRGVV